MRVLDQLPDGQPGAAPFGGLERAQRVLLPLLGADARHVPLRQLTQVARGEGRPAAAVEAAEGRVGDEEALHGPRDPHIEEPPLLLDGRVRLLRLVHRPLVGQQLVLCPGDHDKGELQPLARVEGHELHAILIPLVGVGVRHERHLLEHPA